MGWWENYLKGRLDELKDLDANEKQQALDDKLLNYAYTADEVKFWIDAGADPNAQDEDGRTKLMLSDNIDVVNVLLDSGADVNIEDNRGYKAVSYAIDSKIYELLQSKTPIDEKNGYAKARKIEEFQAELNRIFYDVQEKLKSEANEEYMENMNPYKYEYILNNLTPVLTEKLEKLIQTINENILLNSHETDSLDQLKGLSLSDIEGDVISKAA